MININIYETNSEESYVLRDYLKEYIKSKNIVIRELTFLGLEDFINHLYDADLAIINYKIYKKYKKEIDIANKNKVKLLFLINCNDTLEMIEAFQNYPSNYILLRPAKQEYFFNILNDIKTQIKEESFMIRIPHGGDERIKIKDLNYINIENRSLMYHLKHNKEVSSVSLRERFVVATKSLMEHPELYFMAPSLIVNMTNIKILYKDHIEFYDGSILYFPETHYRDLKEKWKQYIL